MADRDYGHGRGGGWRGRDSSIFCDDDERGRRGRSGRWTGGPSRDDDRGFFERAGDEVRSWFGDEEAERRREMDMRRDEARDAFGGRSDEDRHRSRSQYGPGGYGGYDSGRGAFGWGSEQSGFRSGRGEFGGRRSPWDDNYLQWRERQLEQFDCEYEDYCRERQQQFESDFDSWRTSRLTEGGPGSGSRGSAEPNASIVSTGGGTGSATSSSTGSTGAAETARSRTGRTRS